MREMPTERYAHPPPSCTGCAAIEMVGSTRKCARTRFAWALWRLFLWERILCATARRSGENATLRSRTRCAPTNAGGQLIQPASTISATTLSHASNARNNAPRRRISSPMVSVRSSA